MRRILLPILALTLAAAACTGDATAVDPTTTSDGTTTTTTPAATTTTTTTTTTLPERPPGVVPAWTNGMPWGSVDGLVMFRGNPSRTYHGEGPVPRSPEVTWRFPDSAMCGNSPVGGQDKVWCGTGWTGQPVVWDRPDGTTEVIFGAYDKRIHFVDAATGARTRSDFAMGDIIKGSLSLDPDGYPLIYSGSRDPRFRIIALDRGEPTELWALDAASVNGMWNNDWDSNPVIVDDVMYVGGENSWFFAVKLNRSFDEAGQVTVDPQVLVEFPAFTDELVARVGRQQSIESSVAVFEQRVYFANSAGRVVGLDVSDVLDGVAPVVFDYWMGDDVDSTVVIDDEGMLYVSAQVDLATSRGSEVGQFAKLDPYTDGDPRIWGVDVPGSGGLSGGIWATPAIVGDVIFITTNPGRLLGIDRESGETIWSDDVGGGAWSSPVYVDDTLLVAVGCQGSPGLRAYDVLDPKRPLRLWDQPLETGCIESTPAVWKGQIFVGARDGFFYSFGEAR
ncbi:MAG: PQQ-binding-like beta-propeller repeat protein [Acidimicrobiia bacterium]|nr:PQQ-binding-like beta-propeller repeat protein [Acidimicrobiia bacterium]MBT8213937.1 PQQ-binding-like beta-propeller repeat protein [Acidimicrobiia bacterium]NNC75271.1 PQQ-binding-like beta-propeller repeat protein [Acidimicrobiia bacterium]